MPFAVTCAALVVTASCGDGERLGVGLPHAAGAGATGGQSSAGEGGDEAGRGHEDGGDHGAAAAAATDQGGTDNSGTGGTRPSSGGDGASGGTDSGGTGQAGGSGGSDASGGSGAAGGSAGSGGTGPMGGTGGQAPEPEQLSVCIRLEDSTGSSFDTSLAFESAVIADCRVNWVTTLYYDAAQGLNERADFLNDLLHFNLRLWGCPGTAAPTSFELIHEPAPLSVADAGALIEAYVDVASDLLTLDPAEESDLRVVLGNLSEPLLVTPDPGDFTDSHCAAGGAGGSDAGAAGQGGAS
jgi:hypothetical protein